MFRIDGKNSILKETDKDENENTETTVALMSFTAKDVYGNLMHEDKICSFFTHGRFIIYFNFIFTNPVPKTDAKKVEVALQESFNI
jgi:hypothetical protein